MNEFKLVLNDRRESIAKLFEVELPNVPIKNMEILGYDKYFDMRTCVEIVNKYRATIEKLEISGLMISSYEIKALLENMNSLTTLELHSIETTTGPNRPLKLPSLKSLSIIYSLDSRFCTCHAEYEDEEDRTTPPELLLEEFSYNNSIERLHLCLDVSPRFSDLIFDEFAKTVHNIKHLILEGSGMDDLLSSCKDFKLETLHTYSLKIGTHFLVKQKDSLKELRLEMAPSHHDAVPTVAALFEMRLQNFYLEGVPLILNYETQHVDKMLTFGCDGSLEPGLEILKRGRCKQNYLFLENF
jgi:hypothetical protein